MVQWTRSKRARTAPVTEGHEDARPALQVKRNSSKEESHRAHLHHRGCEVGGLDGGQPGSIDTQGLANWRDLALSPTTLAEETVNEWLTLEVPKIGASHRRPSPACRCAASVKSANQLADWP